MFSKDIWIFVDCTGREIASVTLEMASEAQLVARQLDGKTCLCLIGYQVRKYLSVFENHGVEKAYLLDSELFSRYALDAYAFALQELIAKHNPLIVMFGTAGSGGELASRIAARLKLPCITEAKRIEAVGEDLKITKSCYEDKVYQTVKFCPEKTVVLTVLPGDMEVTEGHAPGDMEIIEENIPCDQSMSRTRQLQLLAGDPGKINIEEADRIIAAGKGIGGELNILHDLADILGASIGGTRPVVDAGTIGFERQIGITGKSVSPRLLIACGVSGAREFIAGIEKAKLTIAINTDTEALIFKRVDLPVLGDVREIIPALVRILKQRKGGSQ